MMGQFFAQFGAVSSPAPIASGDFTNIATNNAVDGVYTLNGSPCAIGDIIDLAFPDGNFNPALDLDAGGIHPRDTGGGGSRETALYLKEPLLSQVLAGYTAVFEANFASNDVGGFTSTVLVVHAPDYPDYNFDAGLFASWKAGGSPIDAVSLTSVLDNNLDFTDKIGSAGIHKIALTATDSKVVASIDGGAIFTFAEGGIGAACTAFYFNIGGDLDARLRSFAFYEVVDDADLPSLSAL